MATFTSKNTGGWDSSGQTTWNEVGVPVAGDVVTIQNTHTVTLDSATACTTLTIDTGGVLTDATNNQGLTVSGATIINGTMTCGTAAMSFGSGITASYAITINSGGIFTGGSGTHTIGTIYNNTGTLTLTSGTTTINSAYVANDIAIALNAGTFNHSNGTVTFTMADDQLLFDTGNTARTFYNIIVNKAAGHFQFEDGNGYHLTVANNLTITAGEFDTSETVSGTSRELTVTGITAVTGTLTLGTAACSFGSGKTAQYTLEASAGGTITGGSGDWTVGSLQCQTATSTLTMTSGTCTIDSCRDFAYGLIVVDGATFDHNNGTIVFTGISADIHVDALSHSLYNLTINSGNTHILRKDLIIANDLTITSGTFSTSASNYALTVTGDMSNSGTFTPNASLVTLNGTAQTLIGSWTFWDFTKSVAAADTLTFDNTATYTFGGNVTLNGASGQLLSILSDSAGNAFDFVMDTGSVKTSLTYLSVKDSDASGSIAAHKPIAPTNSTDVSGNTDWFAGGGPGPSPSGGSGCVLFADYTKGTSLNWKDTAGAHVDTDINFLHNVGASFNGSTSTINYGNTALFNFGTGDYAIEFVCNTMKNAYPTLWATIYSRGGYDSTGLLGYHFAYFRDTTKFFWYFNGATYIAIVVSDITQPNHYILTRNGDTYTTYLNGLSVGSAIQVGVNSNADKSFIVGARETSHFFDGNCPYMRVYKGKGLSNLDARQNFQAAVDRGYLHA